MENAQVKFLTGGVDKIISKNEDGSYVVPIVAGQIFFALSDDETRGYIIYDVNSEKRIVMSTYAEVANQTAHSLTIGDVSFDGSADVDVPIYDGTEM